jgi:WhiB family redox-sensing transcriptional regulator
MRQVTPTQPEYHRVVSRKVLADGFVQFILKFNPRLFERAKCRGIDTEIFYPTQDKFDLIEERYITEKLCAGCPVKEACLEWGLAHERYGIWGGTTPFRRRSMRKARRWQLNEIALPFTQR